MFGGASAGALVSTVLALKTYEPEIIRVNTQVYCFLTVDPFYSGSVHKIVTYTAICSGGANSELHLLLQMKFSLIVWGFWDLLVKCKVDASSRRLESLRGILGPPQTCINCLLISFFRHYPVALQKRSSPCEAQEHEV